MTTLLKDMLQLSELKIGDTLWSFQSMKKAKAADFENDNNVILIHGFTANGTYLINLAETLSEHGFNTFIFNYNSYRGIEFSAQVLAEQLENFDSISNGILLKHKTALVCHSMGGLVGRALIQLSEQSKYVSSLVTLGTPHCGTLCDANFVHCLIKWAENISKENPKFKKDCQSAKELTRIDNRGGISLLENLKSEVDSLKNIPVLSVSAGKDYLEIGNDFLSRLAEKKLRKHFSGKINDGLVLEESSNIVSAIECNHTNFEHFNDYREYLDINHTYIIYNQSVALHVVKWLIKKGHRGHV